MRAGRVLRRIITARIVEMVPEIGGRVYTRMSVPEHPVYPYVTYGPTTARPDDVECIPGRIQTLQVDVWFGTGQDGLADDVTDDVVAALKEWSDTAQLTMHPLQVPLAMVMGDPSGGLHGVVQVEALIES